MSKKENVKLNWLYPANQDFYQKQLDLPVNHNEIHRTFEIRYGVVDAPLIHRWLFAFGAWFFVLLLVLFVVITVVNWLPGQMESDIPIVNQLCLIPFVLVAILGILGFGKLSFNLILHRKQDVELSTQILLQEGTVISGQVIDFSFPKSGGIELVYKFTSPDGKKIKGRYYWRKYYRNEIPENVAVWYCDDKIHTLL